MLIRSTLPIALFLLMYFLAPAQGKLHIQRSGSTFFLQHTVAAKENWYMLGRMYNQRPKELAAFNQTSIEQTLPIGKVIQIPLNDANFTQASEKLPGEEWRPLYHQVAEKEWMFRISQQYNKVPVSQLEKWNGITSDQIKAGIWLIVGYLKVKSEEAIQPEALSNKKPEASKTVSDPSPVTFPTSNDQSQASHSVPTKESKKVDSASSEASAHSAWPASTLPVVANHKGGLFRKYFNEEGKNIDGNAGIFKSSSGWNDGKYYALINNVPVGTIIKVTFSSTGKTIYAKVLGQLPEMRESQGLTLRISEAAASELGADIGKFYVSVAY